MAIENVNLNEFVDLFGGGKSQNPGGGGFSAVGGDPELVDLLSNSNTETTTASASTTDTTTIVSSSNTETTTTSASNTETTTQTVDIFGADDKTKAGRKPKYDFSDMSGYYEDRVKNGKFVEIKEDGEDGSEKRFVPKTPEDFDEVIDIQVNYRIEKEKKNILQQVYQSKTPAWQAVLKYSELVDDPSEIVPFVQGVRTIESVATVDENTPEGAEKIVRARLEQRGETDDLINQQVETLKGADKLVSTAKVYKPLILQQEQTTLTQMMKQREQEQSEYLQMVDTIEKDAVKSIETPLFGKQKLTKDEKAVVYDMIAYPSQETKGYKVFSAIDSLYEKGDFETLKLIALIAGGKKDAVINYIASNAANATHSSIERKLRVAAATSSSTNTNADDDEPVVVRRNQFSGKFGR